MKAINKKTGVLEVQEDIIAGDKNTALRVKKIFSNAIEKIVSHYSQSIHSTIHDERDQETAPYFDPLLGSPVKYPTIIQSLTDASFLELKDYRSGTCDSSINVAVSIIDSYVIHVRAKCFSFRRNRISLLQNTTRLVLISYEMFLSSFISKLKQEKEGLNSEQRVYQNLSFGINSSQDTSVETARYLIESEAIVKCLQNSIHILILDIFEITSLADDIRVKNKNISPGDKDSSDSKNQKEQKSREAIEHLDVLCNWILPTMLRILLHSTVFIKEAMEENEGNKKIVQLLNQSLCSMTIVGLAFCSNDICPNKNDGDFSAVSYRLGLFDILSTEWKKRLTLDHLMKTCAYSPDRTRSEIASEHTRDINVNGVKENNYSSDHPCRVRKLDELTINTNDHVVSREVPKINAVSEVREKYCKPYPDPFLNEMILDMKNDSDDCFLAMPWIDHVKGTGPRIARNLLHSLFNLVQDDVTVASTNECTRPKDSLVTMLGVIVVQLGIDTVLPIVRANFFGRLESHLGPRQSNTQETSTTQSITSMGTEYNGYKVLKTGGTDMENLGLVKQRCNQTEQMKVTLPSNLNAANRITLSEDEDCNQMPVRISSALRILMSIKFPHVSPFVLTHALPILYTLIDSNKPAYQSLGGAVLLRLLTECTPTTFASFSETTAQVLSMACRCCRSPVATAILLHVRCELFKIMGPSSSRLQSGMLRREAVSEFFTLVKKSSHCGPNGETETVSLITSVLVSGVHPLLVQQANLDNADAMEMGRLGLSALLPLIRWDSQSIVGRRVQFAATSCLVSLMMGAYPIMKRHGGKIMSELIACIGRAQRDLAIYQKIRGNGKEEGPDAEEHLDREATATKSLLLFAVHAASVALVICGKRADDILKEIESGEYTSEIQISCSEVRQQAATALQAESEPKE